MNDLNELLLQAQHCYDAADWSQLLQILEQLNWKEDGKRPEIASNSERILEWALAILEFGDFHQRWNIGKVINRLGAIAIPRLIEILNNLDIDEEVRWYAVRLLGGFANAEAIAAMVQILKSSDNQELKTMAASALGQVGKNAIPALTELLVDEQTRLNAVMALSCIRHSETIAPLLNVVEDSKVEIRIAAIEALSSFHDPRIPPILLCALDDIAAPVRREAVLGLGFRPELRLQLDLVKKLQPRLYDFNIDVCCTAATSLARMGCDEAAAALSQVLKSPHTPEKLQLEIIRALIWVGTPSSLEYLQQALSVLLTEKLWQEIATVLGRIQQPKLAATAVEILQDMLHSSHPTATSSNVKSAIALALGQLGRNEAVELLISLLGDPDISVRLHAIAALKKLAPEVAHQRLLSLANSSALTDNLQQGVKMALAEW